MFELLERKKKAIEDVISAYRAFQAALQELPAEWAREVLAEIGRANTPPLFEGESSPPAPQTSHLLTPSDAVRALLRRHPEGLRPNEIVKALIGKVQT